jgi:tetratricopeptide (TPR) repeat protein
MIVLPLVVTLALPLLPATPAATPAATVGRIDFRVSCNARAQAAFTRGVSAMHSFWYAEALEQFAVAEKADASCAMAYWGEAMANLQLLWVNDDVDAAKAALAKFKGEPPTAKERAWMTALRALLGNGADLDPWPRRALFAQAMTAFHAQFPDDDEGKVFLAIALLVQAPDESVARRAQATALALEVLAKNPQHPGALHYAIHATDTPELAPLGLPAAKRYAQTAPEAFHARHMPAHIFARLGMWQEALASCQSAWEVSTAWVSRGKRAEDDRDFHSLQWIVAIDLEMGKLRASEAALQQFLDGARQGKANLRRWYSSTLTDHLRATGEWNRVESLAPPPTPNIDPKANEPAPAAGCHGKHGLDGVTIGMTNARRWAAVARHDVKEAAKQESILVELRQARAKSDAQWMGAEMFARMQRERALESAALAAMAKSDDAAAAARWRELAALDDADPPQEGADDLGGPHLSAAEALLRAGKLDDARGELQRSLLRHPGHAITIFTLGKTCDRLGDASCARTNFARAATMWRDADADYAPAIEARAWLAAHGGEASR